MGLLGFLGRLVGFNSTPNQKLELSQSAASAGLPIIYGHRKTEAITVLKRVSSHNAPQTGVGVDDFYKSTYSGDRDSIRKYKNWLHRIDVWGQGPIEGVVRYWIDGDPHTKDRFSGKRPYFRAATMYGRESQTALTTLTPAVPEWSSAHQGKGVAYSWTRFFNSTQYPQYRGEPKLEAEIKGLHLYDPRKDPSVGGAGSHDFDDEDTWEYGNNRALVLLNYLMGSFGFNAPKDELNLASFKVAADICDQDLTIPGPVKNETGAPVQVQDPNTGNMVTVQPGDPYPQYRPCQFGLAQKRFVADVVIDPKQGVVKNVQTLLEEFGWSLSWSNGRHRLVIEDAGAAPVATFDADTILGGWTIERGNRSERYNRMTVEFKNCNRGFAEDTVSWPPLNSVIYNGTGGPDDNGYLDQDGGRDLHTIAPLKTVTDFYRAQRVAELRVRKSRIGERIKGLMLTPEALLLEPGDVIAIDYPQKGYSAVGEAGDDLFIVENVRVSPTLEVSVDLTRYDENVYITADVDQEPLPPAGDGFDPFGEPAAITNLAATEYHTAKADGSVISGIYLTWDALTSDIPVERIEVKWRDIADTALAATDDYAGSLFLPPEATACRIPDLPDDQQYRVVVSFRTRLLQRSVEAVADPVDLTATTISKLNTVEEGTTRTEFKGAYNAGTLYERGDIVTFEGSSYAFISTIPATGTSVTNPTYWEVLASVGADGAAGSNGGFFDIMFRREASQPATPTGDAPADWSDGPPAADGNPLWMIKGLKSAEDVLIGAWSTPQEIGGSGLEIEYSVNGSSGWHSTFGGSDLYMRQRLAGGGWSAAIRIVGEKGDQGDDGSDGSPGADGSDGADGDDGADGFSISATPSVITLLTTSNGVPKSGQLPATAQIQLLQGNVDRTSPASYSRTAVNCTASVNSSGLVTLSNVSADNGYVDVTASYGGASIKVRITFVKARQGDAATSVEVSANVVNSTTYGVAAGPVSLSMGSGGTIEIDGFLTYTSSPDGNTETVKAQYSANGGGTWSDVGSASTGSAEESGFPGVVNLSVSRSGPGSAATWQFRMLAKKSGGNISEFGSASNMRVQWT